MTSSAGLPLFNISVTSSEETTVEDDNGECDGGVDELARRWPCTLHKLIDEARGDEWHHVMERIRTHPEEVLEKTAGGLNALHEACVRYPPLSVIKELLKVASKDAIRLKNRDGETPLHTASYSASEEVQEALFRAAPESLVAQDRNYGDTPLHLAARAGATLGLMEKFVRSIPRSISIRNRRGATPFWCLRRSYLQAESINEITDGEGADYRLDWDLMVLFLRVSYEMYCGEDSQSKKAVKEEKKEEDFSNDDGTNYSTKFKYLLHAAAATPACPRGVLKFLCRHFSDHTLQFDRQGLTPLLIAAKADVMTEPKFDEPAEGFDHNLSDEDGNGLPNLGDLALQNDIGDASDSTESESALNIVLECNPQAASFADHEGRLPLAHALTSRKRWNCGVKQLIEACPRGLECRDMKTHLHMFQLAAIHSPELETVYYMVRGLPELLAFRETCVDQQGPRKDGDDKNANALAEANRKKRRG